MSNERDQEYGIERRELLRRGVVLGAGGSMASAVLAACGSSSSSSKSASSGGTAKAAAGPLTVWGWQASATGYPAVFTNIGNQVVASQGASKYQYSYVEFTDFFTKLKTASAGGQPPDVTEMSWTGDYQAQVKAGVLEALDSVLPSLPTFPPTVAETLVVDGKTYAIPVDLNNLTIGYNKKIFSKLGLKVPQTLDELIALNAPLRKAGYEPLAIGLKDLWPSGDVWFAYVAYTDTTNQAIRQADAGSMQWTAPPFLQAAQIGEQIQKSGLLATGSSSLASTDAIALFGDQKAAMMYPIGNFFTGLVNAASKGAFEYGLFPFPPPSAGTTPRATGGPAILWSIPTGASNKSGAMDYLKASTSDATKAALIKGGFIPSTQADTSSVKDPIYQQMIELIPTAATRAIFIPQVYTALENGMTALLSGQASAQDVVKMMQSAT